MQRIDGAYLTLVTKPVVPVLPLDQAKKHLRVDGSDEDGLIDDYVWAVNDMLDAEWGELGRALTTQTWKLTLPGFPTSEIYIPLPPVQSITSITYYDADNASQTVSASDYRLSTADDFARIDLVSGASWPNTYDRPDAASITFVAGYGDKYEDIPDGIVQAARIILAHFNNNRAAVTERPMHDLPLGVSHLLRKYRVTHGHF